MRRYRKLAPNEVTCNAAEIRRHAAAARIEIGCMGEQMHEYLLRDIRRDRGRARPQQRKTVDTATVPPIERLQRGRRSIANPLNQDRVARLVVGGVFGRHRA